jgi:hypothetical protein
MSAGLTFVINAILTIAIKSKTHISTFYSPESDGIKKCSRYKIPADRSENRAQPSPYNFPWQRFLMKNVISPVGRGDPKNVRY